MDPVLIYITAATDEEARHLGRTLVDERLAACANVWPAITSVYRWQGEVQEDAEVALIVKTRGDLVDRVSDRVRALHSYDCPCVVAVPITGGNPAFLDWIAAETSN